MLFRSIAVAAALLTSAAVTAETDMPFALDWKFEGPAAPYFAAIDNGYFSDAGLTVEVTAGKGSLDAIPKVATGAFPVGMADINSLVKFLDQNPGAPVTAVMMIYDKPPSHHSPLLAENPSVWKHLKISKARYWAHHHRMAPGHNFQCLQKRLA